MSRTQLALNVDDLDRAIAFYSKLFNTAPAKVKPGYANFAVAEPPLKLVLIENPGHGGTLNHLGIEVESSQAVHAEIARLTDEGMFTHEEIGTAERAKGRSWYDTRFLPEVGPWALYGLLFTIVILFALQGQQITTRPLDVLRIAIPLLAYFAVMWGGGYALGEALGLGYQRTTTLAFTAAGNNFELAIAVAIATYGPTSVSRRSPGC